MEELLTVKMIQEEYKLSRKKADELLLSCHVAPRKKRGRILVTRSEFEKVLKSGRLI